MNQLQRATPNKAHLKKHGIDKLLNALIPEEEDREMWINDLYTVLVNRGRETGWRNHDGSPITVTWLSIRRNDRQAKPDWRHFQWMKNQLVGEENEGVEIYPAESRLVDTANQFHLWVFEDPKVKMPFGFNHGREVIEKPIAGATQRKFPDNRKPKDLTVNEQKQTGHINKILQQ